MILFRHAASNVIHERKREDILSVYTFLPCNGVNIGCQGLQ